MARKPRIGILGIMQELYDDMIPGITDRQAGYAAELAEHLGDVGEVVGGGDGGEEAGGGAAVGGGEGDGGDQRVLCGRGVEAAGLKTQATVPANDRAIEPVGVAAGVEEADP